MCSASYNNIWIELKLNWIIFKHTQYQLGGLSLWYFFKSQLYWIQSHFHIYYIFNKCSVSYHLFQSTFSTEFINCSFKLWKSDLHFFKSGVVIILKNESFLFHTIQSCIPNSWTCWWPDWNTLLIRKSTNLLKIVPKNIFQS